MIAACYSALRLASSRVALLVAACFLLCIATSTATGQRGYWHTQGSRILDENAQLVHIDGVNWYGFETPDRVPHGLTQRDYHDILSEIQRMGFNVIRLPYANEVIESTAVPQKIAFRDGSGSINADLKNLNSLQVMDRIFDAAGALNLRIILDDHRSDVGNGPQASGLWYTSRYPEARWISDWEMLVRRYKGRRTADGRPTLIGVDLRNEPHSVAGGGACWTGDPARGACPATNTRQNWTAAAIRAGNAVLRQAPELLVFVQGTDCFNGDCSFWGSNLQGVRKNQVVLTQPNRVVYSPHDYGPAEYRHPWFNSASTPSSLSDTWVRYWAFLVRDDIAPVWLGEFGTGPDTSEVSSAVPGSQGQWFNTLLSFLAEHRQISWSYWAINGEDRYGLLAPNYQTTQETSPRTQAIAKLLAVSPRHQPGPSGAQTAAGYLGESSARKQGQ